MARIQLSTTPLSATATATATTTLKTTVAAFRCRQHPQSFGSISEHSRRQALQEVGLNKVIEICRVLGIRSPMEPVISLPLGAVDLTPLEMAGAFATFANNGWHSDTTFIVQVTDSSGNVLLDNTPKPKLVLNSWAAASVNSALQGVITSGTAIVVNLGGLLLEKLVQLPQNGISGLWVTCRSCPWLFGWATTIIDR